MSLWSAACDAARTRGSAFSNSTSSATLQPSDPALVATGTIGLAAKGLIDFVNDDLRLKPLPLAEGLPTIVAVGPEGFGYHGLYKTPLVHTASKGVLVGDLMNIERVLQVWMVREPSGYGGALVFKVGSGPGRSGSTSALRWPSTT